MPLNNFLPIRKMQPCEMNCLSYIHIIAIPNPTNTVLKYLPLYMIEITSLHLSGSNYSKSIYR